MVLHTPDRDEVVAGPSGFATSYEPYRPQFLQLCIELNVPVVNLPQQWHGAPSVSKWFRDGIHPNPLGNKEVAKILDEALVRFR